MKRAWFILAVGVCLALPMTVPALRAATLEPGPAALAPKTQPSRQMYEDIEILRRLLDRGIAEAYGVEDFHRGKIPNARPFITTSTNFDSTSVNYEYGASWKNPLGGPNQGVPPTDGTHPWPSLEGVYLKNWGVVYSATLPPPMRSPLPGRPGGPAPGTPLTPWEKTRKELHGEKVDPEAKDGAVQAPPLADVILKVLADNGRHFNLPADEVISVSVTFRGPMACVKCHQVPLATFSTIDRDTSSTHPQEDPHKAPGSGSNPPQDPNAAAPWLADVRNGLLLGELHFKQGKYNDAVAAYKIALEKMTKVTPTHQPTSADVPALLAAVDLFTGLAKAEMAAGDAVAGRQALENAARLTKDAAALTGADKTGAAASPLPTKLIVTASKKVLDQVGDGKTTFEEFRKAATVEYLTFQPEAEATDSGKEGDKK